MGRAERRLRLLGHVSGRPAVDHLRLRKHRPEHRLIRARIIEPSKQVRRDRRAVIPAACGKLMLGPLRNQHEAPDHQVEAIRRIPGNAARGHEDLLRSGPVSRRIRHRCPGKRPAIPLLVS